ncbi:MAG: FimB/Mfa2 family fimbrial subunit [Prevotella sp.]|nr:FimB/Mfa2 family fimbrial subunit [Prevotella sp.]
MKKTLFEGLLLIAVCMLLSACEKMPTDDEITTVENATLTLNVTTDGITPFGSTRAGSYWTHLNFVVYQNGSKVAGVNQAEGDDNYGHASMQLSPGTYQVLVLAHSSESNPTLTNPEKLQFTNAMGFTDTFYYYDGITVTSEPKTHNITLERATALLRFIIDDDMPDGISYLRFYYTGGSGALNARTGYGCVDSKQTVNIDADPAATKPYVFDLYTIPKEQQGSLNLTVTAYGEDGVEIVKERVFKGISIERNKITELKGSFFTESPNDDPNDNPSSPTSDTFVITANTEWGGTITQTY